MKLSINIFGGLIGLMVLASCEKDYKNTPAQPQPAPVSASWTESFTDFESLGTKGWVITNLTDKPGAEAWRKGRFESTNKFSLGRDYTVGFPAYKAERSPHDFISCDMYAGAQTANMSVWLITPITKVKNGDVLEFYTRAHLDDGSFTWAKEGNNRLQVRANYTNVSTNVGNNWTTVGNFTTLMTDINPNLILGGYPESWTKYTLTVSGVSGTINARFAFRYFVESGGPVGNNASLVGIDEVSFTSK